MDLAQSLVVSQYPKSYDELLGHNLVTSVDDLNLTVSVSRRLDHLKNLEYDVSMEKHTGGFISAGGNIFISVMHDMTVEEAKFKAALLPGCKGFTFQGNDT